MKRAQAGLAAVEFAVIGLAAFTLLAGCIEIGRMLFVWNTIGEATRRAARVAVVTSSAATAQAAALVYATNLRNLTTANVTVNYYDAVGLTSPPGAAATVFVTVGITGYQHVLVTPLFGATVTVPAFTTTLPVESLGFDPDP